MNNKIEESNKTFELHIQDAKLNMKNSLEGNKKRIEKGGHKDKEIYKDKDDFKTRQKRYIQFESQFDQGILDLSQQVNQFENEFNLEIEQNNSKRLAKYEDF